MGGHEGSSRTLLDLPTELADPLERNAVALELSDELADDEETVRELLDDICRWNGPETPSLHRHPRNPLHYDLQTGLHARPESTRWQARIDEWDRLAEHRNPLNDRFSGAYKCSNPETVARLIQDLHDLRANYDEIRAAVRDYNEKVEAMTGFVDESDLQAFAAAPDDDKRTRLIFGDGGLGQLLGWSMVMSYVGDVSPTAAEDGTLKVDIGSDVGVRYPAAPHHDIFEMVLDDLLRSRIDVRYLIRSDWEIHHVAADYVDDEIHVEIRIERGGDGGGEA